MKKILFGLLIINILLFLTSCFIYGKYPAKDINVVHNMPKYVPESLSGYIENCVFFQTTWEEHPIYGSWLKFFNVDTLKIEKQIPMQGVITDYSKINYGGKKYYANIYRISPESTITKGTMIVDEETGNISYKDLRKLFDTDIFLSSDGNFYSTYIDEEDKIEFDIYSPPEYNKQILFKESYVNDNFSDLIAANKKYIYYIKENDFESILKRFDIDNNKIEELFILKNIYTTDKPFKYDSNLNYFSVIKNKYFSTKNIIDKVNSYIDIFKMTKEATDKYYKKIQMPSADFTMNMKVSELASPGYYNDIMCIKDDKLYCFGNLYYKQNGETVQKVSYFTINIENGNIEILFTTNELFYFEALKNNKIIFTFQKNSCIYISIYDLDKKIFVLKDFNIGKIGVSL